MAESALPVRFAQLPRKVIYEEVDVTLAYLGLASPGDATSAAKWMIQRLATDGQDVTITFADGNGEFDNIWDDRASLSYS